MLCARTVSAQTCTATAGSYCPSTTGSAVMCLAGYYCSGDAGAGYPMEACPVGTANPTGGQSTIDACVACDANLVATAAGQATCQACAAGSIYSSASACSSCAAGTYAASGDTGCSTCAAGSVSVGGAGTCSACRPGTFSTTAGSDSCTSCPSGQYTYTTDASTGAYTAVWGATSQAQCRANPSTPTHPLVCVPGTRMVGAACVACPIGYYCPLFSTYAGSSSQVGMVRMCPVGQSTPTIGAIVQADCTIATPLLPFTFARCAVTPGDVTALTSLTVRAVTASASTDAVYFATSTAVYRLFMQSNTLELLAGAEGIAGSAVNAVGHAARFSSITAIAVDLDNEEASVVVVGDGASVRLIHVYTRAVVLMGAVGDVSAVGGIALRRDPGGVRWAYVSDPSNHRILAFGVDSPTQTRMLVAGDVGGQSGFQNAFASGAQFNVPMGLAFLERALDSSRMLLVADSGNGAIRVIDTVTRVVSTWFAPLDNIQPELSTPVSIAVSGQNSIVYVADSGNNRLVAIQMPVTLDYSVKVLTPLTLESTSTAGHSFVAAIPYGSAVTGSGNAAGYDQLVVLDGTGHTLESLVQDMRASSADGGGGISTCHLPCAVSGCGPLSATALCGNGFLDAGEECDNPETTSGCEISNCTIKTGYTCPVGQTACLSPCEAFVYAPTGASYCAADCAALTPTTGYTVDAACVETDINECVTNSDNCDMVKAECVNTPGAFQCKCFSGYYGDGQVCKDLAYAVYTVVDIPNIQSSAIATANEITAALLQGLRNAYAQGLSTAIPSSLLTSATFSGSGQNAAQLATLYTSYSLDPSFAGTYTRMELVTLFETNALATDVARLVDVAGLGALMSQALFAANTGVAIVQAPKVRPHSASSFLAPTIQGGWGMNVTSVSYNRTCSLQQPNSDAGFSTLNPRGGCWQIEMVYMGGQQFARSDESADAVRHAKNVLYLPRIERNADTMAPLIPAQTLTMSSGVYFPCDVTSSSTSGGGIGAAATACCLRSFERIYRPNSAFQAFVDSASYTRSVPEGVCLAGKSAINDTFPYSDVVFELPSINGGGTNDLVTGHLEGMASSEVRLLETIDYTTRTYRVMLVLEEGDLRNHASMVQGVTGVDYNMTFFVGLANFRGTGGSVMTTQNAQQHITVSKSNSLTISTFGANQDPLLSSQTMQLMRIKVTDFFNPVKYMYYLKVTFTLPANFKAPPDGSIVPLSGIRLIKTSGGQTVTANAAEWQQVCSSTTGTGHIYADAALQALVDRAQSQPCIQADLQMCYPPLQPQSVVTFGLPLPLGFVTEADFAQARLNNPSTIQVQMVVRSYDNAAKASLLSSLAMAVEITPLGFTAMCETASASQTLADIIDGSIYIGMATSDAEWDTTMQKQTGMQTPGPSAPGNALEFNTVTVQSSMMTFAALGAANYFEDARYLGQTVNMHDLFTVNFLEPLGGIKGGPTPNFDAVKTLFFAGKAFKPVVDAATHNMWLVPTAELLSICPLRPRIGKMACITKIISTFANNALTRSVNDVIELRIDDPSSIAELQNLVGQMLLQGGGNDFSRQAASAFYTELVAKLGLNNRYRKATIINPVVNWHLDAIKATQPGLTPYTVCTKIVAIGLITISSASGQQVGRRLLSMGLGQDASSDVALGEMLGEDGRPLGIPRTTPQFPRVSLRSVEEAEADEEEATTAAAAMDLGDEHNTSDDNSAAPVWAASFLGGEHQEHNALFENPNKSERSRRLLQSGSGEPEPSLAPTPTTSANSLVVNIDAPGYDAVSQLCPRIGATLSNCRMIQYTTQVSPSQAAGLCSAHGQGTLATVLNDGFAANLAPDGTHQSNVTISLLTDLIVSGCPGVAPGGGRQLLQHTDLVIVVSRILLRVDGSMTVVDPSRFAYINFFNNATFIQQLLGGQAVVTMAYSKPPPVNLGNGTFVDAPPGYTWEGPINITIRNITDPNTAKKGVIVEQVKNVFNSAAPDSKVDTAFVPNAFSEEKLFKDITEGQKSGGVREAGLVIGLNMLLAMGLAAAVLQ